MLLYITALYKVLKWKSVESVLVSKVMILRQMLLVMIVLRYWLGLQKTSWEKTMREVNRVENFEEFI